MKTAKDLELSLLLKESNIQQLKLKIDELEDKIIGLETERDVLESKVSDLKAQVAYYKMMVKDDE